MTETKREQQLERERAQVENGVRAYRKALAAKDASDMTPGQILIKRAILPTITELESRLEAAGAGRGRAPVATAYLQQLQLEPVAFITARVVINAACKGDKLPKTAMAIGQLICEHYQFDELRAEEPNLASHMERKAKKWTTAHGSRAIMRKAADVASVKGLEWSQGEILKVGLYLVDAFIAATGLVETEFTHEGRNKTAHTLRPTEATSEWLTRMHERCELLEPRFTPMVVPPKPWTSPISGGYLTRENRVDFVGGASAQFRDDLFSLDLSEVYEAVNAVQATAWRINRPVFDVLAECWSRGETIGGLPSQDWDRVPPRPAHIPADLPLTDMPDPMRQEFDAWRRAAAEAHEHNATLISKRLQVAAQVSMASDVKGEEAIYFPHNVDFRGRLYSVVPGLNPQGNDIGKSLLQFAEGKPLGESGAYWLHVHIANLFGYDKVSFDERVTWAADNHAALMDSAINPLDGDRFWTTADDPWCALAACFEYAGLQLEGLDYVSHLPIAMDGSCSGLQHYSAMLLDEEGAAAVNLLPCAEPSDIYTAVAEETERSVANDPDQLAQSWRGKVTRKIAKRPCMTFAYSVTARGMRDQIIDELKKATGMGQYLPGWDNFQAANYIAPRVEESIRATVRRAAEAMDWLKACAKLVAAENVPIFWLTPDGFPVHHRYVKTNGKRFDCWFNGQRLQVQLRTETARQDSRKQQAGVAPNYVHSMDATHLRMVVRRLADAEVTQSFAMIHDSFAVHACDVDAMHFAIRDEFINLYSENRLAEFRDSILDLLPPERQAEVPDLPEPGNLDLELVREADFFFS